MKQQSANEALFNELNNFKGGEGLPMVFLYESEGGELGVIESVPASYLFVCYERLIITTARDILGLHEQICIPCLSISLSLFHTHFFLTPPSSF